MISNIKTQSFSPSKLRFPPCRKTASEASVRNREVSKRRRVGGNRVIVILKGGRHERRVKKIEEFENQ